MTSGPRRLSEALRGVLALGAVLAVGSSARVSAQVPDAGIVLPGPQPPFTVLAVGDISECDSEASEHTARIADEHPGPILTLGDLAYERGTREDFQCFDRRWGRHKARIHPVPGNHEYYSEQARPYFEYFGKAAGTPGKGFYSFDHGNWHFIALNTNDGACNAVPCDEDSEQVRWLKADLSKSPHRCTIAFLHHPRFSSGVHGDNTHVQPIWRALYQKGTDLVLTGHDHDYERFEPLNADGQLDPGHGMRLFIVGTGGRALRPMIRPKNELSATKTDRHRGVLKLTLYPDRYDWELLPVKTGAGPGFSDRGSGRCH